MPNLFGRNWSKTELLKHIPDESQVARIQRAALREGRAEGLDVVELSTGSGFQFTVAPGRGMDIPHASYKGIPLCWRSYAGDVAAPYFEPEDMGWMRGAVGGLMCTGGLNYMGSPSVDEGEALGIHGRASFIPASNVLADAEWEGDEYRMWVQGKVSESEGLSKNLVLSRQISTQMGASGFVIRDRVENRTFSRVEHMMLYHFNIGFPVLSSTARLYLNTEEITPRDEDSVPGLDSWDRFEPPAINRPHQLYYHRLKPDNEGKSHALLVGLQGEAVGPLGVYLSYTHDTLPWLVNWKAMVAGDYVTGIEPANAWVQGRAEERAAGRLQFLEPWETVEYEVEFGILDGEEEIRDYAMQHQLENYPHA